ncbi:hypothetical protein FZEAL_4808 [Fusarium zealandicum]|uniref:Uncharacterized protein n=1 Tax=Fusarium zealandicum TaxID=1053134 RepID=A0A8H4UL20_9HYPO|nr:hypothetical protein FZEAL_4808 [Fusarium zealandicum]
MRSTGLIGLLLTATASAAPFKGLNSIKWTPEHVLKHDEVILYGEGRMEVVHESVYHELCKSKGLLMEVPESPKLYPDPTNNTKPPVSKNSNPLDTRDCAHTTSVVTDATTSFVDWDIQMSPVIVGTGEGITVTVISGFSVSNGVTAGGRADLGLVKERLGISVGVDYTRTWTSSVSINIGAKVENGYSGVMITRPFKTRRTGRVMQGCIGSQTEMGTFQADSYTEKEYAGVKWVSVTSTGGITLCAKKEFPLTRCNGGGTFV